MANQFKYTPSDFVPLKVKLNHLELYINFLDDGVEVTNTLDFTVTERLESIDLDARDLEIVRIRWIRYEASSNQSDEAHFNYDTSHNRLTVNTQGVVEPGTRMKLQTVTRCIPSDHILEGIYRDFTPEGRPQQYMSQCQQWGFQRIAPIFDDCRAKCTMKTTIEADARYTHLISNGNICREANPEGRPIISRLNPLRQVITYINPVPMAPYLFIVCVGTWDTLVDRVVYESGKEVRLEYLTPLGRSSEAMIPMEILKRSALWVGETQDYEYTGDTYRTICMTKSNFGGMENVGNTTIVTDAALVHEHTLDSGLMYAHAVIVHEFEHNQCGSETTMDSPFDVWLNEAYTVDVERRFMSDTFDPGFTRLNQVDSIRHPLLGPLAIEDTGKAGRIVRDGFNDPDELIDGVTYVKAAEVIRMLRLIVGPSTFVKGKDIYFKRFRNSNATTQDFFDCFEEAASRSLSQFRNGWLYRIGYPKVEAQTSYNDDTKEYEILFQQKCGKDREPFHIPIQLALLDDSGHVIKDSEKTIEFDREKVRIIIANIQRKPAFASLNRGYSFYGSFCHVGVTDSELSMQAKYDPDTFNRVEAMRSLTDKQRIAILENPDHVIDPAWLDLYGELLEDDTVSPSLKAFLIKVDEQPLNRNYFTWYPELVTAKDRLMLAINDRYRKRLIESFKNLETYEHRADPKDGIEARVLKQTLLELISAVDSNETHEIILDHFRNATTATDRVGALNALNRCSSPSRKEILNDVHQLWHGHLSAYANYLRIISSGTRQDVFEMIEIEKNRAGFDVTNPTWSRALFIPMAMNNRKVWTDEGIDWTVKTVTELAPVNTFVASLLLNVFQQVQKMRPNLKDKVTVALRNIAESVGDNVSPTVHRQALSYLR